VVVVLVELMLLLHDVTRLLLVNEGVMVPDGDFTAMLESCRTRSR